MGKSSLIEEEGEVVLAQISLHKIPGNVSAKPIPIAIPHPLRQQEDCDMCLIVKDNAKAWIKEMVENEPVEGLTKVRGTCRGTVMLSISHCGKWRRALSCSALLLIMDAFPFSLQRVVSKKQKKLAALGWLQCLKTQRDMR